MVRAYEVIIIQNLKTSKQIRGILFEAGEYYPEPSKWGRYGWTFETPEAATNKFNELTNNPERLKVPKAEAEDWY